MSNVLDKLFLAADQHAEDSAEPDHAVGDLQDLIRMLWSKLPLQEKLDVLHSDEVDAIIELGAREAFSATDLIEQAEAEAAGTLEVHQGYFGYEGTTLQVEFETPVGASTAEKDAAFLCALAQQADVEYLVIGELSQAAPAS